MSVLAPRRNSGDFASLWLPLAAFLAGAFWARISPAGVLASAVSPDGKHLVEIADYDRRQVYEIWQTGLVPPAPRKRLGARVDALRDVSTFAIAPDSSRVVWRDLNTAAGGSRLLSSPWLQVASGVAVGLAEVGAFEITCDSQNVQLWGSAVAGGQLTLHCAAITGGAPTPGPCPRATRCPIFVDGFETGGTGAWR